MSQMQLHGVGGNGDVAREDELSFSISVADTNLILEALGQLPFARVFELIGKIQRQARAQLAPPSEGA